MKSGVLTCMIIDEDTIIVFKMEKQTKITKTGKENK